MLARLPDLDPGGTRAKAIGTVQPLGNDALGPKLAHMGEHGRPASLSIAQRPRLRSLPVQEWEIAQSLAIMFDQVEGVQDPGSRGRPSAQFAIEARETGHHHYRGAEKVAVGLHRQSPRQSSAPNAAAGSGDSETSGKPCYRNSIQIPGGTR
jgi:hypothetical protein